MSMLSDLASAYAERELTVPVICGSSSTRAFFNVAGAIAKVGNLDVQTMQDTLFIQKGSLAPDLEQEVQIQVGALGAIDATAGDYYRVARIAPINDGLEQAIELVGGPE